MAYMQHKMLSVRDTDQALTKYGWAVCAWTLLGPFQYGWHISVLNQIQGNLTCASGGPSRSETTGLPTCFPMNDAAFSAVTSTLCLGGFMGSLGSDEAMERLGRRGLMKCTAMLFFAGSALVGISTSVKHLLIGRRV